MIDPIRRCILSGDRAARANLVRLALAPDGMIHPDVRAKAPGRGAWIGVTRGTLEAAITKGRLKGALSRAFKTGQFTLPTDLPGAIAEALEKAVLDRLGLESRAGTIVIGGERIEKAARSGKLHLLLHASDAGADGTRKLDQAWRVGRDEVGGGLRGLVIPLARPILSVALGRENVVHIGVTDPGAARRLREALDRWLHFIGPEQESAPCETASQGASAFDISGENAGPADDDAATADLNI
ncbi:MAG: transcription terminating nucleic-acid-binding protein [Sphingomonas sp. 28-66-16]|nr:MAG: transcription terminating nucleic-acid-binding protein [Sphingomonas sp. 28-66-16]